MPQRIEELPEEEENKLDFHDSNHFEISHDSISSSIRGSIHHVNNA